MFTPKEIENFCSGRIATAQQEKKRLLAERQKIDDHLAEAEATLVRLNTPFAGADYCPLCFYDLGIVSALRHVGAPPERPRVDAIRCSREHYFEDGKF